VDLGSCNALVVCVYERLVVRRNNKMEYRFRWLKVARKSATISEERDLLYPESMRSAI
jgi:hypothetical protein